MYAPFIFINNNNNQIRDIKKILETLKLCGGGGGDCINHVL